MNEDAKLNDFLKEQLEAGVSGEPPRLDAILQAASAAAQTRSAALRSRIRLWGGLLAAASLAVLCLFAVHLWVSPATRPSPHQEARPAPLQSLASMPSPEQTVVDAIDLLSMVDGDNIEVETNAVADVLLAWQDAPYEDAVSDLLAGN